MARRTAEAQRDGAIGQPRPAPLARKTTAEHGAHAAVHVANRQCDVHPVAVVECSSAAGNQLVVERVGQTVVLGHRMMQRRAVGVLRHGQHRCNIQAARLPVIDGHLWVDAIHSPHGFGHGAKAKQRQIFAHFLGDEFKKVHHKLGLTVEVFAQLGVLRRNTHRASVQVAHAHHDATAHHEWRGGKAVFFSAQQRSNNHVATGFHLPVGLHHDAVTQTVEHERLLRFGQPEFPRCASVFERSQRRRTRATVVPRDEHHIGFGFAHACSHRAHANFGHQLHVHACFRVGVL